MATWSDIVTLWAFEDDSRLRERTLARHSLLMKIVERKALEAFRQALSNPHNDWRFHLSTGLGYDLDRLQAEIETAFPDGEESLSATKVFPHVESHYNRALEALGDARRAERQDANSDEKAKTRLALLDAAERLYDRIEGTIGDKPCREFLADGLRKTEAWLAYHDDPNGKVAAQRARLLIRRLEHETRTSTRC